MKKKLSFSAIAIAVLALSNIAFAEETTAQPVVVDEAEALAMDAKIYAESYGVSYDEALERLTVMLYGENTVETAASSEGSDLAGRYYDNGADFGLVVKTKSPQSNKTISFTPKLKENYGRLNSQAKRERNEARKKLREQFSLSDAQISKAENALSTPKQLKVKYQKSEVTLSDLNTAIEVLSKNGSSVEGYNLAFIDERESSINVILDREVSPSAQAKLRKLVKVPVTFEVIPGGMQPVANMRGGSKLYANSNPTNTSSRYCMSSFGAKHNTAKTSSGGAITGLVTAAHCTQISHIIGDDGKVYPLTTGATLDDRGSTNRADLRFVYNANNNPIGVGQFYFNGTSEVRNVTGTRTRLSTAVGGGTPDKVMGTTPGSFVCHLGQTSYGSANSIQSCGEVISVTAAQSSAGQAPSQSNGYFVMIRNTQSGAGTVRTSGVGTLRCYQGDSGGPVFAGTVAFGVVSACGWTTTVNTDPNRYLMYTSTDYFNNLGVSILVP